MNKYKNIKNKCIYSSVVLYFFLLLYFHGQQFNTSIYDKPDIISIGFDFEVYSLIRCNEKGEYVGIFVDLMKEIFKKRLFKEIKFNKIEYGSNELLQYKVLLNKNKKIFSSHFFIFSLPILTNYDFIIISRRDQQMNNLIGESARKVGMRGNVLYYFSKKDEDYEYVNSLEFCYNYLESGRTVILEKDLWSRFKNCFLGQEYSDVYEVSEINLLIEPICLAIFYDCSHLLRFINKYIRCYEKWKKYENSI